MLVGNADLAVLAARAPQMDSYADESIPLEGVTCVQMTAEMRNSARESVLPPSLHPTVPPALCIQAWWVADSAWGPFHLVSTRICCRSGVRARGFTTGVCVDSAPVAQMLARRFGFPVRLAAVRFRHGYDGARLRVETEKRSDLDILAVDPQPLGADDVQYTTTLNLAKTPDGLRLVQVETRHEVSRAERLQGRLLDFDAAGWGEPLLEPYHHVSTSLAKGRIILQPIRFVCRADELAFTGTEAVNGPG
jgi:hypothetical protein